MKKQRVILGSMMAMAFLGCGKDDEVASGQRGYRDSNVVEQASLHRSETLSEAVPAASQSLEVQPVSVEPGPESAEGKVADSSTAPDLLAKISKETAIRGETVDIVAEASTDVVDMILSDGYGTSQALTFDAGTGTWRTSYRVPLKMHLDRLGLSIVAHNDQNRWRRVWVFLSLPENAAKADSCQ